MHNRAFLAFLVPVFFLLAACAGPDPADLVLSGGTIYTAEPLQPVAAAVAVRDGRIVAVGDETEVLPLIGEGTRVIDLDGAYVYPGFTDSHVHLRGVGERELTMNLDDVGSIEELQDRVRAEVADAMPGEWISGRGWIETHWNPSRFPNRQDLDRPAPMNPVVLTRADGHALVANSRALELAGIDKDTKAPFGGEILRDARGNPTGMLIDNAMELVTRVMTNTGVDARRALVTGARRSAGFGWTGVQIAGNSWDEAMLLHRLIDEGEIPVRIYNAIRGPSEDADQLLRNGPIIGASNGRFTLRAIKVSVDGALGSRGAALLEPYADAEGTGLLTWRENDLAPLYEQALHKGIQLQTHAIGDRANRFVLDLYEAAFDKVPPAERRLDEPRWRIEHAQILAHDDISRFATLNVIPSMQFSHAIGDLHFAPRRLGEERLQGAYAWRSLRNTGVIIPGGSDAPVEQGDPRIEFYAAVSRSDLDGYQGENWQAEQAMTREEALLSLTMWPAYAAFEENVRGSVAPGKFADFTVLGEDIMTVPVHEIPDAEIIMTIVGGEIVHSID